MGRPRNLRTCEVGVDINVTAIDRDDAIVYTLKLTLSNLQTAQTMMEQHTVSGDNWPEIGKLLSEIERTMKQIEFGLTGHVG